MVPRVPVALRIAFVGVLGTWACWQQQFGTPINVPTRSYWREVYHENDSTYRGGFNMAAPLQVWKANPVLAYDAEFDGSEYRGELGGCDIEPIAVAPSSMSEGLYPLRMDSGWILTTRVGGQLNQPHADAFRVFTDFYLATGQDSIIPVFEFPRYIEEQEDFSYLWRGFLGWAFSGGEVFPSIWLNTRELEKEIFTAEQSLKPFSTLAHEMAHVLLDPFNIPGQPIKWGDNSTPFLHIQTHMGWLRFTRTAAIGPGPITQVYANDVNRRYLLSNRHDDACIMARAQLRFVRPVLP